MLFGFEGLLQSGDDGCESWRWWVRNEIGDLSFITGSFEKALASQGKSLDKGMVVITGSMIPPIMLNAGDTAVVSMDGLGDAVLNVG